MIQTTNSSTLIQTDRFTLSETERSAIEHEMHHYEDPRAEMCIRDRNTAPTTRPSK